MPPATFILLALVERERHGYAIMQEVERTASVRIGPGTLHGSLKRLVLDALVEEIEERSDERWQKRRRYYRLTMLGRAVRAPRRGG